MKRLTLIFLGFLILSGCEPKKIKVTSLSVLENYKSEINRKNENDPKFKKSKSTYFNCSTNYHYLLYNGNLFTGIKFSLYDDGSLRSESIFLSGEWFGYNLYNGSEITKSVTWDHRKSDYDIFINNEVGWRCDINVKEYDEYGRITRNSIDDFQNVIRSIPTY